MIETKIIDNVIVQEKANIIENTLFHESFPWHFQRSIGKSDAEFATPGFFHLLKHEGKVISPMFNHIRDIVDLSLIKSAYHNLEIDILIARAFLLLPFRNAKEYDYKHVDIQREHIVCLYYVNDTDGDTFIFGKDKEDGISQRIQPKKNRVVLFDGLKYHSSSCPTQKERAVINFNLVLR